jgi:hypothetical protein
MYYIPERNVYNEVTFTYVTDIWLGTSTYMNYWNGRFIAKHYSSYNMYAFKIEHASNIISYFPDKPLK